jgi:hypothetical protein
VQQWIDRALLIDPANPIALKLRRSHPGLRGSLLADAAAAGRERRLGDYLRRLIGHAVAAPARRP